MSVSDTSYNRLIQEDEDSTTEMLVNLMKNKFFRDISLSWLLNKTNINKENKLSKFIEEVEYENILTQVVYYKANNKESFRPDIVINTINYFVLIENKIEIDRKLEDNQKTEYPKLVKKESEKRTSLLLFLIPEGYDYEDDIKDLEDNQRYVDDKGEKLIYHVHWSDFIRYLYQENFDRISECKDPLEVFSSVIAKKEVNKISTTKYELSLLYNPQEIKIQLDIFNNVLKSMQAISNLIINSLSNKNVKNCTDWKRKSSSSMSCGKEINIYVKGEEEAEGKSKPYIFYGFYFDILNYSQINNIDDFVFCVGLHKEVIDDKYKNELFKKSQEEYCIKSNSESYYKENKNNRVLWMDADPDWYYFPIDRTILTNKCDDKLLLNEVVNIIKKYLK